MHPGVFPDPELSGPLSHLPFPFTPWSQGTSSCGTMAKHPQAKKAEGEKPRKDKFIRCQTRRQVSRAILTCPLAAGGLWV